LQIFEAVINDIFSLVSEYAFSFTLIASTIDRRNITLKLWAECGQHLVAVGY
jgi:hypothetical protein